MKKTYLKPDADYIKFYSDEELTNSTGGSTLEGSNGEGDNMPDGWN